MNVKKGKPFKEFFEGDLLVKMDLGTKINQLSLAVREKSNAESIADALAAMYIEGFSRQEAIAIKKYIAMTEAQWQEVITILENKSARGVYCREYSDKTRAHFLFVGFTIDQKIIDDIMSVEDTYPIDRLDIVFYTPLLQHFADVLRTAYGVYHIKKWADYLEMWDNNRKELINPQYQQELTEASIRGTRRPNYPWFVSSRHMDGNFRSLSDFPFKETGWYPIFLFNVCPGDQYLFEKGAVVESATHLDLRELITQNEASILKVSHFVLYAVSQLYGQIDWPHFSLVAPGWPIDLLKSDWTSDPKWFPKFMESQAFLLRRMPWSISL